MTPDERDAEAGEYVLGSMPLGERQAFERRMADDAALQATVRDWEERLAGLNALLPDAAPDPDTWRMIELALERMTQREAANANQLGAPAPDFTGASAAMAAVLPLRRSRARWRVATLVSGAIAAGLALFVINGSNLVRGPQGASYLAVVNRGGDLPALVVQVDTQAGIVRVRSLAAETPPDRNLELWYIAPTGGAPRSLGLIDQPRREQIIPAVARAGGLAGATLAVSVEPVGGSTTGAPTGPVIYSGKLIQE